MKDNLNRVILNLHSSNRLIHIIQPRSITQADRLLNTPAPLVDNTRTTHSPTLPHSQLKTIIVSSTSSSSLAQEATKTPCNQPCNVV
ncbi:hypothetical protein E2C01_067752 [Portunus trituberculatus]|uniref:Uncharacterized protein n=1 Tax=Portunus trituberculatus TaxID=210409 RepID=A0A5B7HY94_PORTR|nr:hypothetical protein [Portunus trituberculatus]